MSEREEHRQRWADEIAAYALGALDEREAALLEHHLDECEQCASQLAWLRPAVDAIPASVEQLTPPPELRERLLSVVREEAAEEGDAPAAARERRRFRLPLLGSVGLRPALAGAAVLLLAAGVAGYELRNTTEDGGSPAATRSYAATVPGTPVRGTLEVEGDKGYLHIENMPANRPSQVYQAWLEDPAVGGKAAVEPSSVFVVSQDGTGEVMLPHGLEDAAKVMITREPKGGSERPSEPPMMTVELG